MDLHEKAKVNFNEKGKKLLNNITERKVVREHVLEGYSPDINISANIESNDIIGDVEHSTLNEGNSITSKWFTDSDIIVGFNEENYKILRTLAEDMQRNKKYKDIVSLEFVENMIFEWVKLNYRKEIITDLGDYFVAKCKEALKEQEIWIPIFGIHAETDIELGKITIRTITRNMLDEWIDKKRQFISSKLTEEQFLEYSKRERKDVQGFAAVVVKVRAEPIRAFEVAYELAEESLAILRVLSPYNISPKLICYCVPLGKQNVEMYKYYHVHDGRLVHKENGVLDHTYQPWILNRKMIAVLKENGFEILGTVLQSTERTKFQELVLNSLIMYSRSCLMKEPSDKLVYILVALESLLLKNENEPIMQNIAERMAFVVKNTADERKSLVKLIKDIYGLRSKFIHHGQSIDNMEQLEKFMYEAFLFFIMISLDINKFTTKESFIEKLEEMKFS